MKILVTAGATWVKVDDVRIMTNRFTGKTGLYLAKELTKKGHEVTLIVNPHCLNKIKGIKLFTYHYFNELRDSLIDLLKRNKYDLIVHTAAISDYRVVDVYKGKIPSKQKEITLRLLPTEKIIKKIRKLAKESVIIQFKLEAKRKTIIEKAYESLKANDSDFVVANAIEDLSYKYKAFLIDRKRHIVSIGSKKTLVNVINEIALKAKVEL